MNCENCGGKALDDHLLCGECWSEFDDLFEEGVYKDA